MFNKDRILGLFSPRTRNVLESYFEAIEVFQEVHDPKVLLSLGPSGVRGLILQRGKQGKPTKVQSHHQAFFNWDYPSDHAEMVDLYRRAKQGQWDGDSLAWKTSVDPLSTEIRFLPESFMGYNILENYGIKLNETEKLKLTYSIGSWLLSQFLHGEQGALFAAAQVTEAVQIFDGKLYGATQVMDEGRHVEVFHRYLDTKLNKLYQINDNLFVIIDALISDSRWDMKFLGMQIMVEGLALGAFGTLYKVTQEPLLKEMLRMVIQDEARHVHYGVLALREHFTKHLTERERREREDWAFEVALLMRNRFLSYEVYEEWFEGILKRSQWKEFVTNSPGMVEFRRVMFSRLVPNLREIGLMSPRILSHYDRVGLLEYFQGPSADQLTAEQIFQDLDSATVGQAIKLPENSRNPGVNLQ